MLAGLIATCAELEQRIADLEKELRAKSLPHYCGIYRSDGRYRIGDLVTNGGGLWLATDVTSSAPGTDKSWRLIGQRGRA